MRQRFLNRHRKSILSITTVAGIIEIACGDFILLPNLKFFIVSSESENRLPEILRHQLVQEFVMDRVIRERYHEPAELGVIIGVPNGQTNQVVSNFRR